MYQDHSTPSTPQHPHAFAANARSPLSRHGTPSFRQTLTKTSPPNPCSNSQAYAPSIAFPDLKDLPPLPSTGNVVPMWLDEHLPLSHAAGGESVLAALIAFSAAHHRICLRDGDKAALSWEWYVKELSRRKMIYGQITGVLADLVRAGLNIVTVWVWADFPDHCSVLSWS